MSKPCPLLGTAIYLDCLDCESKACRNKQRKYKKVVIGIDQSYKNTGICIVADKEMKKLKSIRLGELDNNSEKRRALREQLTALLDVVCEKGEEVVCIIERIRLRSQGFLNIDYIKSIGALNSIIVDCCHEHNVTVYSVDTRCWKSQVVGTSKPANNKYGVPNEKWPTVRWCLRKGWEEYIITEVKGKRSKGTFIRDGIKYQYNDDAADSAGIAMFGFVGEPDKLHEER